MRESARIVVVDDDPDILELVAHELVAEGEVVCYERAEKAGKEIANDPPELVVLDLMMPDLSGEELCKKLREDRHTEGVWILMLTAKAEEQDRVNGLEAGADDYLCKPFSGAELRARVRAMLRRSQLHGRELPPGLDIDCQRCQATVDGTPIRLTATEFRLLQVLAERPGQVWSRSQLIDKCLPGEEVYDRTVDAHVRSIRSKLGARRDLVQTVRGMGYRLEYIP